MSFLGNGLDALLGKAANWIPDKREKYRKEQAKLRKEADDIITKYTGGAPSGRDLDRYNNIMSRLWIVEKELEAS